MLKNIILFLSIILFALFYSPSAYAFPPYLWAENFGGTGDDASEDTGVDGYGNVYITGWFSDTIVFGDKEVISNGKNDIFIAKLNSEGECLWVKSAGSAEVDCSYCIYVNFWGYSIITGCFQETVNFGDIELVSDGNMDMFIAKLDPDGNFLWAKRAGGVEMDVAAGIIADSMGYSYITGCFSGNAFFGDTELTCDGQTDIFIAKISPHGNFLWATKAGGADYDAGISVAVDTEGNIYCTGSFMDTAYFGDTQLVSNGDYDIFIAGLYPDGSFKWAKGAGAQDESWAKDYGRDIATDSSGNVYVTGGFHNTTYFDDIELTAYGYENASDIFIAKLNADGDYQWVRHAGQSGADQGMSIFSTPGGDCYFTGYFQEAATFGNFTISYLDMDGIHIFAAKMDTEGNFLWAKGGYGYLIKHGNGIAVDNAGCTYISGYFYDTVLFDSMQIYSAGERDILVAKLSYGTPSGPDASIVSQDIVLSPSFPSPGDTVEITARVRNTGTADINSGNVNFYFSQIPGTDLQLIESNSFSNIAPSGYSDITINWNSDPGLEQIPYVLTVEITGVEPSESYTGNNTAYKELPLPVEIGYFLALGTGDKVRINWMTVSEIDNLGFNLYRLKKGKISPFLSSSPVKLNDELIQGQGTSSDPADYSYSDNIKNMGKYIYILESVSISGETREFRTELQWIL